MFTLLQIVRDSRYFPKLRGGFAFLLLVHLVGTAGYLAISGGRASVMDALYMTFITVATIGYGEVIDLSGGPWGRIFTMGVGFFGIGGSWYLFSTFTAFILETNLNQAYRRKRMESHIDRLSGHYIVCGIGRVGSYVADELVRTERDFVVIEASEAAIAAHEERTGRRLWIHGDAADDTLLERAGIARAAGVFAVTGDDAKNLVVSLSSKQLNPAARVVARVHDQRNVDKTRRAGADEIVSPDFTGGLRIASAMLRPHAVNLMDMMLHTADNLRVEEVPVPPGAAPRRAGDWIGRRDWILVAVRDTKGAWAFNPAPDHPVSAGDPLVVIASPGGRRTLEQSFAA